MISIVTGIIGILVALMIVGLIRKDRLHVSHGLGWIVVAIGFAFLGFAPSLVDKVASYLGVAYPPVLALTIGVVVLVIKILLMDIERSHIEARNQRLVQRIAMLEADLRTLSRGVADKAEESSQDLAEVKKSSSNPP